jgi:hypothetical protein
LKDILIIIQDILEDKGFEVSDEQIMEYGQQFWETLKGDLTFQLIIERLEVFINKIILKLQEAK